MEQTKALNALEPFLALSKSATSPRAAADLIVRATSAPNTYIFTELLQTPQIQALASSDEFSPYLTVLRIFCHGTYSSYTSTPGLPELNDAQRLKLRQLSLLTLAKKDGTNHNTASPALDYASLQTALDLPSRQALEELVISAIYAGLIKAQLNPKNSRVRIDSVSPLRDVAPTAIGSLLSSLKAWAGRCDATLESLSCQMAQLRAEADRRAARTTARAREVESLMEKEKSGGHALASTSTLFLPPASLAGAAAANSAAPRKSSTRNINTIPSIHHAGSSLNRGDGGVGNHDNQNNNTFPSNTTTTTITTTTNTDVNSLLTVGGGSSSSLAPGAPGATLADYAGSGTTTGSQVRSAVKRGSGQMDASDSDTDGTDVGDTIDMDDEDDGLHDGQKRASRRKLEA
ncbi:hypothetical protein VTI28DRAFT_157 [Corynascus sepedonium]